MKLSDNGAKIEWFVSWQLYYYSTGFDFKIYLLTRKVTGPFENQAPGDLKVGSLENDMRTLQPFEEG